MAQIYDLIVIGAGPAGYPAAIRAAQMGADVALVEGHELGGVCLNRGCIPTKALIYSARAYQRMCEAGAYGVDIPGQPTVNFPSMVKRKQEVVNRLVGGVGQLLQNHGVTLLRGCATIPAIGRVMVRSDDGEQHEISGRATLIATGSQPAFPPIPGKELSGVISGEEATELEVLPERLAIIGGGVIGLEMASFFAALGVAVIVAEMQPGLLPGLGEPAIAQRLMGSLRRSGVDIHLRSPVRAITRSRNGSLRMTLESHRGTQAVESDLVIMATGRRPRTAALGLAKLGVEMEGDSVVVDQHMRTNVDGLYAAGDCTGGSLLASVASYEGLIAAENVMGSSRTADYRAVPNAIFTMPEVATVGLTEREARRRGLAYRLSRVPFAASGRAMAMGDTEGQVRMICDATTDTVLGIHIIGPQATELIAEASLAVRLRLTATQLARTIHAHPTLSEVLAEAAWGQLEGAIHHHGI